MYCNVSDNSSSWDIEVVCILEQYMMTTLVSPFARGFESSDKYVSVLLTGKASLKAVHVNGPN